MKKLSLFFIIIMFLISSLNSGVLLLKVGQFFPECNSDLWEINFDNLILDKNDFKTNQFFLEWEFTVNPNAAVSIQVGSMEREAVYTEYRDYVDMEGEAIGQAIRYDINPIELNFKFYPLRKRSSVIPYFGAGLGLYRVEYEEWGEFIDFNTNYIYEGDFLSKTTDIGGNGFVGLLMRPSRMILLGVEGRYQYLKVNLSSEFEGFEPLDFSGLSVSLVFGVMF